MSSDEILEIMKQYYPEIKVNSIKFIELTKNGCLYAEFIDPENRISGNAIYSIEGDKLYVIQGKEKKRASEEDFKNFVSILREIKLNIISEKIN